MAKKLTTAKLILISDTVLNFWRKGLKVEHLMDAVRTSYNRKNKGIGMR